jgi:transcriptional regulator with XRE-family HTH domain
LLSIMEWRCTPCKCVTHFAEIESHVVSLSVRYREHPDATKPDYYLWLCSTVTVPSGRGEAMPVGPTVRRRRLGSELRRLRESQSIKLEVVAERLGLAPSTLSRIETGKAPTRTAYLNALLDLYGVADASQRQALLDMARAGHRKGWWAVWDGVLPTGFGIYVGLEAEAASLRVYEAQVVHGLLQTADYARAVMTAVRRRQTPEEIERLVELRIQRQSVLHRPDPLELWLILDEAVLWRMAGPSQLMSQQLEHLYEASQWPNVTLQILRFSSGLHPALGGSFAIIEFPERLDPDVVYTEGVTGQAYIEERDREVRAQAESFDLLRASALPPAESALLVRSISERSA